MIRCLFRWGVGYIEFLLKTVYGGHKMDVIKLTITHDARDTCVTQLPARTAVRCVTPCSALRIRVSAIIVIPKSSIWRISRCSCMSMWILRSPTLACFTGVGYVDNSAVVTTDGVCETFTIITCDMGIK